MLACEVHGEMVSVGLCKVSGFGLPIVGGLGFRI